MPCRHRRGRGARRPRARRRAPARVPDGPARDTEKQARPVRCRHFPDCVGCPWVHRPYGAQLADKQERLRVALAEHPQLGRFRLVDPSGSPHRFGYRNHAKLVFRSRRGQRGSREALLGVYRPGTHSVVPAHGCTVHDLILQPLLEDLRELVEERGIPIFDERRRAGDLRYALARSSRYRGKIHLTLVSAKSRPSWLGDLVKALPASSPDSRERLSVHQPHSRKRASHAGHPDPLRSTGAARAPGHPGAGVAARRLLAGPTRTWLPTSTEPRHER